jgi:molybdopterin adenylyltransferase
MSPVAPRVAILTISDGVYHGTRKDVSGNRLEAWIGERDWLLAGRDHVPDEANAIAAALVQAADSGLVDVVVTTGGTGFTLRDVTPEATRRVLDRIAPGIAEALRAGGAEFTPFAWLSRGIAGMRGRTLIVNLPGSTTAVEQSLHLLGVLLPHAVQLLRGEDTQRHPESDSAGNG